MGRVDHYRSRSFWLDSLPDRALEPRKALPGDVDVDVAVVGAGYTGLWTAFYLKRAEPGLRITVLDSEIAGYGASGRNGGWCSALLPMSLGALAARTGRQAALDMAAEMRRTIDEVGSVTRAEGIDCDFIKGGSLQLATSPAHVARIHEGIAAARRWGIGDDDLCWLGRTEAVARVGAEGVLGGAWARHCAALHPARLVRGLAEAVERLGVTIHERTPAREILPGRVRTPLGTVTAEVVVRATEGFTATLAGMRRKVAPLYSLMIATEPLPPTFWESVGWQGRDTVSDGRHLIIYAQRTADDRIAFGGRGAPYHFGSRVVPRFDRDDKVHDGIERALRALFPGLNRARITHRWGGPIGVARDWWCSVGFDRGTGLAWAGGYVGDGVATSNLAGRTLADLITGAGSDLARLPWVDHRSPDWEPEPLRWIGINGLLRLPATADAAEMRSGRRARRRETVLARLTGG